MKRYYGYIRVSTTRQGEQGSSLQEQKAAIEAYAQRHGLNIIEWFEEQETAAAQGRPIFARMLKGIERKQADGVITHKIDRSARNLKDWAHIGELIDHGVEMHFAHESLDLTSRSGRLSADILAVVASDYIRNLRDEIRKGFYGRLKQGIYPLQAPLGYLDQGGGKPKAIDPIRGPLVRRAFELYATGQWTLRTLLTELHARGLRNRKGKKISTTGLSTVLNNPFYIGVIKLRSGETFAGIHQPLVDPATFSAVSDILAGRKPRRGARHKYRYQQLLSCALCKRTLVAERQKGHVYYRCHVQECPGTCLREERIDEAILSAARMVSLTEEQWRAADSDLCTLLDRAALQTPDMLKVVQLELAVLDDRMRRTTDAYIDGAIDKEVFFERKEGLSKARAALLARQADLVNGSTWLRSETEKVLELTKALSRLPSSMHDQNIRDVLARTSSNLSAEGKKVDITWRKPFDELVSSKAVFSSGPNRGRSRTEAMFELIFNHVKEEVEEERKRKNEERDAGEQARLNALRELYANPRHADLDHRWPEN